MTAYPEGYLARELELCYANISMVTDHDVGVEGTVPVSHEQVVTVFNENNERLRSSSSRSSRRSRRSPRSTSARRRSAARLHRVRDRLRGARFLGAASIVLPCGATPGPFRARPFRAGSRGSGSSRPSAAACFVAAVTDFFQNHTVLFALLCALFGIAVGLYLTWWILKQPAGTQRMQEIARAVQEGAAAYLRRQYMTIGLVAVVPFLHHRLLQPARLGHRDRLPRSAPSSRRPPASSA